eukprot:4823732-Amphidinium_carterae.1
MTCPRQTPSRRSSNLQNANPKAAAGGGHNVCCLEQHGRKANHGPLSKPAQQPAASTSAACSLTGADSQVAHNQRLCGLVLQHLEKFNSAKGFASRRATPSHCTCASLPECCRLTQIRLRHVPIVLIDLWV